MKTILVLLLVIFSIHIAAAQTDSIKAKSQIIRICGPSRSRLLAQPLYIFYSGEKLIYQSNPNVTGEDPKVKNLNPKAIESIDILQGDKSMKKYGDIGKNGTVEIYLKKGYRKMDKAIYSDTTVNSIPPGIRIRGK